MRRLGRFAAAFVAVALGAGCTSRPGGEPAGTSTAATPAATTTFLDQGWSPAEREAFWFTSQGSRILSYDIFVGLERADGPELFGTSRSLAAYGYIPAPASP